MHGQQNIKKHTHTFLEDLRTFLSLLVNNVAIVFMITLVISLALVTVIIFSSIFTSAICYQCS
jgi:hypothetical protein